MKRLGLTADFSADYIIPVAQREAVISSFSQNKRYLATAGLGPCVALILYNQKSQKGALAHLDSMTMLNGETAFLEEFKREIQGNEPEAFLIGGIKGKSDHIIEHITQLLHFHHIPIKGMEILTDKPEHVVLDLKDGMLYAVPQKDIPILARRIKEMTEDEIKNAPLTIRRT